jgi:hypothetical protein
LATFLAFAAVSFSLGIIGQPSCGCFGQIQAGPWHAFAVDVACLILLVVARPDWRILLSTDRDPSRPWLRQIASVGVGATAIFAFLVGLGFLVFGSPDAALAHLRGERISIRPRIVYLGQGQPREQIQFAVDVINRTNGPIRLIGGTADSSCLMARDLPLTLAPGEVRHVSLDMVLPEAHGFFQRKVILWTDDQEQARTVVFNVAGKIDWPKAAR